MRFIKCENKSFSRLFKFTLGFLLLFNCIGAGNCQTKKETETKELTNEEKYDAQLNICVEQEHEDINGGTKCLENLLKSNPDRGFINIFLARAYARSNQLDKAEETINVFLSQYPSDDSGYDARCQILSDKGELPAAMKDCLMAIRLAPEDSDYQLDYARVKAKSGDVTGAEDIYRRVLAKKPEDVSTLVALGRLYEKTNQINKAIETYERLLKLDFNLKDRVREGIEKLKKRREKESNKDKNTNVQSQEKSKTKTSGN